MGYSWIATSIGGKTLKTIFQEISDNLDLLNVDLELPVYSWVNIPVKGQKITSLLGVEQRTVTDDGDDQNYCRTHYATYNVSHDSAHDASHLNDHNSSHDDGHDTGEDSTQKTSHLNNHNSGYHTDDWS